MSEDRGQKTEDRGQKTEDRGQKTEDRGQRTEDREQRTEDREQRTENRGQIDHPQGFRRVGSFVLNRARPLTRGILPRPLPNGERWGGWAVVIAQRSAIHPHLSPLGRGRGRMPRVRGVFSFFAFFTSQVPRLPSCIRKTHYQHQPPTPADPVFCSLSSVLCSLFSPTSLPPSAFAGAEPPGQWC
jgi:hypothetical protein